jgi:hypothetical protein
MEGYHMTALTRSGASLATMTPSPECSISGYLAGEPLTAGDACNIKPSDGKIYKSSGLGLSAPDAPALTTATSGGTVADGFYGVKITYVNANGESVASEAAHITAKGASADQSTITVVSPAAAGTAGNAATKYKVYITPKNGGPYKLQNTTGTNIGTNFTLSAPPATNTATPPTGNTTGAASAVVDGFVPKDYPAGRACTLYFGVEFNYGTALTPGTFVYLDDTTAGALNDAPTALGTVPIGRVTTSTVIHVKRSY